ncbi:hypothetical protein I7X13_19950, partial [Hymenobacter sp. BT442]|nr:hypothetical protein [Hymenobacter negativus]
MANLHHFRVPALLVSGLAVVAAAACQGGSDTKTSTETSTTQAATDTADTGATPVALRTGNAEAGRDVYRNETFGDEGFWTDA